MNLAERIYTLRTERGLSQLELAEALDVSRQSISKWETGAAVPELDKLLAMSRFFGLTVGALLGVEEGTESAPDGEADNGELTPQQIKMVQEIVDRYLAALPENAPRKPKRWVKVLAVAAAIALVLGVRSMRTMSRQIDSLSNQTGNLYYRIDNLNSSIYSISDRVAQALKEQNGLTVDYDAQVTRADLVSGAVDISFRAIPRTYEEGLQAWLEVENNGEKETFGPYDPQEQTFSGEITTSLTDDIKVYIVFERDGVRQTQLLRSFDYLYHATVPDVMVFYSPVLSNARFDKDKKVILDDRDPALVEILSSDQQTVIRPTRMTKAQLGLFRNHHLVAWAQEREIMDESPSAKHHHYQLPEMHIACSPGDELVYAAQITDEYGREFLIQGTPSVMQPDGTFVATGTYEGFVADYSDWVFTPES